MVGAWVPSTAAPSSVALAAVAEVGVVGAVGAVGAVGVGRTAAATGVVCDSCNGMLRAGRRVG